MRMNGRIPSGLFCTLVLGMAVPLLGGQTQPPADPAFQEQFQRGQAAVAIHKYNEAIAAFKKANKLRQNSCVECYLSLAAIYIRMSDSAAVFENCGKVLSSATDDPTRATAHNLKGYALLMIGELDNKKLKEAETEFRTATQLAKDVPSFHMNLARALLRQSRDEEAVQELKSCLALGPSESLAEQARRLIADPRRGRENFAPDFHVTTLQGQEISLQQLAGKIIVLDFWATWCPPCRASVSELKALTRKYSSDKLVLISISADSDEKAWRDFVGKKDMNWPQFWDIQHSIIDSFSVRSFPTYFVIDGEGIIKQRIVGMDPQQTVVYRLKATLESLPQLKNDDKK